ncbi:hypothetical protein Tco_0323645 [Tanacetum coccineum]
MAYHKAPLRVSLYLAQASSAKISRHKAPVVILVSSCPHSRPLSLKRCVWISSQTVSVLKYSSPSTAAGAREATGEGITGEADGDSRDHSGDVGVPTNDGGV